MIPLDSVKRSFVERNGLFLKLLTFFLCFWLLMGIVIPKAYADELQQNYGYITVRETWQNVTVKSDYYLGLYTKEDKVITTNFLINNPDWGITIKIYGNSNLRITANGKTLSWTSGEIQLNSTLANSFGASDSPIYFTSTSETSTTYHIRCYGSYALIEDNTQEEQAKTQHKIRLLDLINSIIFSLLSVSHANP